MNLINAVVTSTLGFVMAAGALQTCACQSMPVESASFEAASIHQDDPSATDAFHMTRIRFYDDGSRADHASVKTLLAFANDVDEGQIEGGPLWIGSDSYEIEATYGEQQTSRIRSLPPDERRDLQRAMLMDLLSNRFRLQIARSSAIGPVYAVVVSKGGAKLRPSSSNDTYGNGLKDLDGAPAGNGFVGPSKTGRVTRKIQVRRASHRLSAIRARHGPGCRFAGALEFALVGS